MPRKILFVVLLAAIGLAAAPAWASGDFTCVPSWTLANAQRTDCDNQPFLSPGNDSRVNLQLLLLDAGAAKLHPPAPRKDDAPSDTLPISSSASPFTLDDFTGLLTPAEAAAPADDGSGFPDGEGSRCRSNGPGNTLFQQQLDAAHGLPAAEKAILANARAALRADCSDASKTSAPNLAGQIKSPMGQQFATYLAATTAFYAGDYDLARQKFADLKGSAQPWLKETSRYMLARVELNRAQADAFDEYGVLQLAKVDAEALAAAAAAFHAYLHDYPNGDYAASAQGLLRRVDWLGGQSQKLAADFIHQFAVSDPTARNVSEVQLVQEADSKLLTDADAATINEPLLLAAYDLLRMRTSDAVDGPKPPTPAGLQAQKAALAALEAQRPAFAGHAALFDYLLAAHAFYDEKDPAGAFRRLPPAAPNAPMTYLEFSRQVLRGLALEAAKDNPGARKLWLQLIPAAGQPLQRPVLDLALAMNYERGDALAQVYATGSPIRDPDVRAILLRHAAGPLLLRQRAKTADAPEPERRAALSTLLWKEISRGRYQAFVDDLALMPPPQPPAPPKDTMYNPPDPDRDFVSFRWQGGQDDDGYACPSLREVARALARDPQAAHGLLCLDEFVRINGFDDSSLDVAPPADQLGGAPSQFPGSGFSRLASYQQLLANPKTPPTERAYTLFRAVSCYAPSGNNHCTGPGVDSAQRKRWFHTLKTDYASSPWAKSLKYYW